MARVVGLQTDAAVVTETRLRRCWFFAAKARVSLRKKGRKLVQSPTFISQSESQNGDEAATEAVQSISWLKNTQVRKLVNVLSDGSFLMSLFLMSCV